MDKNIMNQTGTLKDWLGRNGEIENLTQIIKATYKFEDEAYVLGLNAQFGNGKTTFLKLWKQYLETQEDRVFYLDIWKDDFLDDPLPSLCLGLATLLDNKEESLIKTLKKVAAYGICFGSQIVKKYSGYDAIETAKAIDDLKDKVFVDFQQKLQLMGELKKELEKYVGTEKPLFIFIDELDRARPDYAIKFLETIKHLFSVKGLVFVIAADNKYLESAVKKLYGELNFEGYYRKFITSSYNLGSGDNKTHLKKFVEELRKEHLGQRDFCVNPDTNTILLITAFAQGFNASFRDVIRFFKDLAIFLTADKKINDTYLADVAIILLAFLILKKDPDLYRQIGEIKLNSDNFQKIYDAFNVLELDSVYKNYYYLMFLISMRDYSYDDQNHQNNVNNLLINKEIEDRKLQKDNGCSSSSGKLGLMKRIYRILEEKRQLLNDKN